MSLHIKVSITLSGVKSNGYNVIRTRSHRAHRPALDDWIKINAYEL